MFAVTEPPVTAYPEPSVVVVSTFSENVNTMVLSPVLSAVNVGATLSVATADSLFATSFAAVSTVVPAA